MSTFREGQKHPRETGEEGEDGGGSTSVICRIAGRSCSRRRCMPRVRTALYCPMPFSHSSFEMARHAHGPAALTVAERGAPVSIDISPK